MKLNDFFRYIPQFTAKGVGVVLSVAFILIILSLIDVYLQSIHKPQAWLVFVMSGLLVLVIGLLIIDYISLILQKRSAFFGDLQITRHVDLNLPKDQKVCVSLSLTTFAKTYAKGYLMDSFDNAIADNLPIFVDFGQLNARQNLQITYEITPTVRGWLSFFAVDFRLISRLGLLQIYHHVPTTGVDKVKVFANFKETLSGNLLAVAQKQAINGLFHQKRRGQGQDFHQIRGYNESDSIRHIDWKATSRLARLMTKEFSDEQDQKILFLVDSSSHMRHFRYDDNNKKSHIDSVLDSMFLLASVAVKQGDAVGFVSFSGNHDKVVAPKKSADILNTFVAQSFDIEPSLKVPDYMQVAKIAMNLQKKRGLIVLMTSTRHEDFEELMRAVNLLRSRHLVIVANLYEDELATMMNTMSNNHSTAIQYHAIYEHLSTQQALNARLANLANTYSIHCQAKKLPFYLVNRYLTLKSQLKLS